MLALQVALDFLSIEDALTVAKEATRGGANWLEVGTPLIKNHGVLAIKKLKSAFQENVIVADMKTMDTGDLEVEIAAKNGADVVCVLGLANDFTIKRAVNSARAHEVRIMADLIGVENKIKRAKELEGLGVDYILLHAPIDIQKVKAKKADAFLNEIGILKKEVTLPIAVAGGINLDTIGHIKRAGAEIFVVGRAVTRAKDVEMAAKQFCRAIGLKIHEKRKEKISIEKMIKEFETLPTPFISDAMKRFGAMKGIKPVLRCRIAGRAFTVKTLGGDWGKVVKAIDQAGKNDVIVVDAQGADVAVWGELATLSAIKKGIKGVVIDGAIRDVDGIKKLGFPVWCKSIVPNAGEPHGHGELQVEINCGGMPVKPGDVIVADEIGVVVVPIENSHEILQKAKEVSEKEKMYKSEIEKGKTLSEIFGL